MKIPVYCLVQNIVKTSVSQLVQNIFEDFRVSHGSEQCEGSRVQEVHVYTQDSDRFRPLKRRVEVSMRNFVQ